MPVLTYALRSASLATQRSKLRYATTPRARVGRIYGWACGPLARGC